MRVEQVEELAFTRHQFREHARILPGWRRRLARKSYCARRPAGPNGRTSGSDVQRKSEAIADCRATRGPCREGLSALLGACGTSRLDWTSNGAASRTYKFKRP